MPNTSSDAPRPRDARRHHGESVARCGLDDNQLVAARIAALAAVDAPAASYLMHVGAAS